MGGRVGIGGRMGERLGTERMMGAPKPMLLVDLPALNIIAAAAGPAKDEAPFMLCVRFFMSAVRYLPLSSPCRYAATDTP